MFKEFKNFALKGNVIDMAVGIIIGAAFGTIVKSLVDDIIMPPIGLLVGNVDFSQLFVVLREGTKLHGPYATVKDAAAAGAVTLNYGVFINCVVSFLIVAFSVFLMVKVFQKVKSLDTVIVPEPVTKECPYCFSKIPKKATKCGFCTSVLP
ncbi:MAG: large-conductance mechanosensitive channel protein MscL [Ignavibacteriaceae bacterium]|nr:large-conductance mechanosensitive channel protein MscL [Ignavibacteriaceae bacterium]